MQLTKSQIARLQIARRTRHLEPANSPQGQASAFIAKYRANTLGLCLFEWNHKRQPSSMHSLAQYTHLTVEAAWNPKSGGFTSKLQKLCFISYPMLLRSRSICCWPNTGLGSGSEPAIACSGGLCENREPLSKSAIVSAHRKLKGTLRVVTKPQRMKAQG